MMPSARGWARTPSLPTCVPGAGAAAARSGAGAASADAGPAGKTAAAAATRERGEELLGLRHGVPPGTWDVSPLKTPRHARRLATCPRQGRMWSTYPPSTRSAPPVVAEAWSELR